MTSHRDAKIVETWATNAAAWISAVRNRQIESRAQVTDAAIVDVVLSRSPSTVLDLGCGEGWLARKLSSFGCEVIGTDTVSAFVDTARSAGAGAFYQLSYDDIVAGKLAVTADAVVINFALFGHESSEQLIRAIPALLNARGVLVVQTLHPLVACGHRPYRDGWREGSWTGFSAEFRDPAPWYFRTLESWINLFTTAGFTLLEMREPVYPMTQQPASVIFVAGVMR